MPDARLQRTRATLPEGYQYGDARPPVDPDAPYEVFDPVQYCFCLIDPKHKTVTRHPLPVLPTTLFDKDAAMRELGERYVRPAMRRAFEHNDSKWRAPHENAAAQLKRRATAFDDMTAHSAAEMLDLLESQRTGDETL